MILMVARISAVSEICLDLRNTDGVSLEMSLDKISSRPWNLLFVRGRITASRVSVKA